MMGDDLDIFTYHHHFSFQKQDTLDAFSFHLHTLTKYLGGSRGHRDDETTAPRPSGGPRLEGEVVLIV